MLEQIQEKLTSRLVRSTWSEEMTAWGAKVRLYRDYADGLQRSFLTVKQRKALNISTDANQQFVMNYCDMVIQTMADRLSVASIKASGDGTTRTDDSTDDTATAWADRIRTVSRFDALQNDVHEASLRDGVTFVMEAFDNRLKLPTLHHEPAYDGEWGLLPVYDRMNQDIIAAVKIWWEGDSRRVNLYFPDRIEKYVYKDDIPSGLSTSSTGVTIETPAQSPLGRLEPLTEPDDDPTEPWRKVDRVPVIAFPNRGRSRQWQGVSELASLIPLQDSLNRTLIDMIMTSSLTAFQIRYALGFRPPEDISPGGWVTSAVPIGADEKPPMIGVLPQGDIVPFVEQAQFLIDQIGTVSRTPLPRSLGGDTQSGEALKQREIGLLGKVEKYQVRAGNAWEDAMTLAARIQAAFGVQKAPVTVLWDTQWRDAQIRNDADVIDNAIKVRELVGEQEALRLIAQVYGYDQQKIDRLQQEKTDQRAASLRLLPPPDFNAFDTTTGGVA